MSERMDTSQPSPGNPESHDSQIQYSANYNVRRPRGNRGRGGRGNKAAQRSVTWKTAQNEEATRRRQLQRSQRSFDYPVSDTPAPLYPTSRPPQIQSTEIEAVKFLGMAQTTFGRPIPIATQAIGFIVNQYYIKLQQQLGVERVTERCTIHQFYRHSLAQLSYHLYRIRMEQASRYSYSTPLPDPPIILPSALEAFKVLELNVGFITSYISRIGVNMAHDIAHVPILMMDISPFYVNTFTLRAIIDRANLDADFYEHMMRHNSIPGLQVRAGRIVNADIIMPQRYDAAVVYHDASAVRALMNYTASKMRDINVYTGRLGQLGEGNAAMLLSSTVTGIVGTDVRIPPSEEIGLQPVTGNVESYWSTVKLTEEQIRLGILGLYQREAIWEFGAVPEGNQWLLSSIAPFRVSADYLAYLNRLIG